MDLQNTVDTGLVAATAGSIRAGGLLIVGLCLRTNCSTASDKSVITTESLKRFHRLALVASKTHPESVQVLGFNYDAKTGIASEQTNDYPAPEYLEALLSQTHHFNPPQQTIRIAEQDNLYALGCEHLDDLPGGCTLIRGRRGRGKSTLMARLLSHSTKSGRSCLVTAFHSAGLTTLLSQLQEQSRGQTQETAGEQIERQEINRASPEVALTAQADVLFVEEAANFPLAFLNTYLSRYKQVVLCTTLEGYEASGRALDVRMLETLRQKKLPLLELEPRHSWRWAENDPLEQFIDSLILSGGSARHKTLASATGASAAALASQCRVIRLDKSALAHNEERLAAVHALLQTTHYQTTTKDLEHLIDSSNMEIWVQQWEQTTVGVLIAEREGSIDTEVHDLIMKKKRRLPHQLLPQLLAQCANDTSALELEYIRVVRVSITPPLRRLGLASKLLQALTKHYEYDQYDDASTTRPVHALGASFASDEVSLQFWQSNGFTIFHRGYRANPRTGKQSVAVLKSTNVAAQAPLGKAVAIYKDNERARFDSINDKENPKSTRALSTRKPATSGTSKLDLELLQSFAAGYRSMHDSIAALKRLEQSAGLAPFPLTGTRKNSQELDSRRRVATWLDHKTRQN